MRPHDGPKRERARWRAIVAATIVAVALAGCGGGDGSLAVDTPVGDVAADHAYLIPAGTGELIDAGEPVEILPGELTVRVGEVLRIVNEDDRGHLVGPFYVGAGETLSQRFTEPGEFEGVCSVHPSGRLVLEVLA